MVSHIKHRRFSEQTRSQQSEQHPQLYAEDRSKTSHDPRPFPVVVDGDEPDAVAAIPETSNYRHNVRVRGLPFLNSVPADVDYFRFSTVALHC